MTNITDLELLNNPATGDTFHIVDVDDITDNPNGTSKRTTVQSIVDLVSVAASGVTQINGETGAVTLDADDIDDTSTSHKFATAAQLAKVDGVESGATADQTGAEIKVAYEGEADTNAFTDAEKSKLAAIEASATADQTGAEIVSAIDTQLGGSTWQSGGGGGGSSITYSATAPVSPSDGDLWMDTSTSLDTPVRSATITTIVALTQAEYDALGSYDANTLYHITS